MRKLGNISLLLFAVTTISSAGCSNLDSWVRSAGNPFRKEKPDSVVDTTTFDASTINEAGKAWQSGNHTLAEERYKDYLEKNQRSEDKASLAVANYQLGRIAFEKSDFMASNRYFDEAIKLDPNNVEVHGLYGQNLYMQKEYHRAESIFLQALQIAPNDRRFQIMLGRTMAQQKQYQAGLRYLKQALGEQGAYEEMARIYTDHSEFDKATLAMGKARESHTKQQQLAARFPNDGLPNDDVSVSTRFEQQRVPTMAAQSPGASQTPPYQPSQTAYPSQQQPVQIHQQHFAGQQSTGQQSAGQQSAGQQSVVRQNVTPQQVPVQQYQYPHQYAVQQPVQSYPQQQQPVMIPNISYSNQPQYPPAQNNGAYYGANNNGIMNPAVQSGQYSGQYPGQYSDIPMPQQPMPLQRAYENYPQQPQDNRPPQGFAATGQRPMATAPTGGMQTIPVPYQQNHREIAWYPNYSDSQPSAIPPGPMQPGTLYPVTQSPGLASPGMPSPINPLAERHDSAEQSPTPPSSNSAFPMTGNWNNQTQSPVFSGYYPPY